MKVTTDACLFGAWVANEAIGLTPEVKTVLDIGTGTGLLALMYAQENSKAIIQAIETDEDAADQAAENIATSPWENRIKIINADARNFSFPQQYDVIISNPPFYKNDLKAGNKKKNIAHHGDDLSLAELLAVIKNNLSLNGKFYLLLPYKRNEEIMKLLSENELTILQLILVRQSVEHDYFRIMLTGKLNTGKANEMMIDEIAITDKTQQYTPVFKELLQDFYLRL